MKAHRLEGEAPIFYLLTTNEKRKVLALDDRLCRGTAQAIPPLRDPLDETLEIIRIPPDEKPKMSGASPRIAGEKFVAHLYPL